jgi:glutathione S-transferase
LIVVHHLERSRSQRVLWLLEELGLSYEVVRYRRDPQTLLAPAALRAVHPLGKSPIVTDGADTVAESGAITEFLLERYDGQGRLAPAPGTPQRRRYTYWLHYAEGSAMPPLVWRLIFRRLPLAPLPAPVGLLIRPLLRRIAAGVQQGFIDPEVDLHLDYLEGELGKALWFAGAEFSAADILLSFPIESAAEGAALQNRPRLADFLARIRARPAYLRARQRGEVPASAGPAAP